MTAMSIDEGQWLTLSEASKVVGVHFTTLRRWADSGSVPCFRTPGGHRRFRADDLARWMERRETAALVLLPDSMIQSAVGYTRREMAQQDVARHPWHAAFSGEAERREMGETGRSLFGLAIRYITRNQGRERVLKEGQRIGRYYGRRCAQRNVPLVETVRAFIFFRRALSSAMGPGQAGGGQFDAEDARIQQNLHEYLDEVMCACLDSYERNASTLRSSGGER
jgi:excisionase family DNA binding protein